MNFRKVCLISSSFVRQLNQNVDERGRNIMCERTLPSLLVDSKLATLFWESKLHILQLGSGTAVLCRTFRRLSAPN